MTKGSSSDAVAFLRQRLTRAPRVGLILGSGLGGVSAAILDPVRIPYGEIPGFPRTTVAGHRGSLVAGIWEGVEVIVMEGRFHLYEGWAPSAAMLPLRVFADLGVGELIVTNSSGGVNPRLRAGELMLIADHINLMFRSPLMGPVAAGEDRFPDMSDPYDPELRAIATEVAAEMGIELTPGVFAAVLGPSYETPAEVEMLRLLGADAVGMSTVPEVIVARALGMRVLGISCIANQAASRNAPQLSHEDVLAAGAEAAGRLGRLLKGIIPRAFTANLPSEAAS